MTLRRYRRPPGRLAWDHVLSGAVNRALADLEGYSSLPQVAGPTQMIAGVPVPASPPARERFLWVEIDGPNNGSAEPAYDSWHEARDKGDGTFEPMPDGLTGSASLLAYEVRDRDAPVGAVVPAWLSGDDPQSVTFEYSPPPEPLTVREVDGSPSVSPVTVVEAHQATGLKVTDQGGGVARLENVDATTGRWGVVNTAAQTFAGVKGFRDSITVYADGGAGGLVAFLDENGTDFIGELSGFGPGSLIKLSLVDNGGSTLNFWQLSAASFNLSTGVYQAGGTSGVTDTQGGLSFKAGLFTGGSLSVPGSSLTGTINGGSY